MTSENARKPAAPPKFKVGEHVRVKHGIMDTEYPDMPIGGWAGTVTETHDDRMYTVRWSRETLDNIHPVYKKRSEKDGTVLEEYWLGDDDLEPDSGGPLDIEQPTEIKAKPLSPKDQDDRIRMVFGLTSNDPLPSGQPSAVRSSLKAVAKCGLLGAFYGIVVGAALRAIPGAEQGIFIGGGILGVLGALFGIRYGLFFGALNRITFGSLFGGVVGAVNGALLGGFLGVLVTAWMAAIPGAFLGSLIVTLRRRGGRQPLGRLLGAIAGAGIGTGSLAFHRDYTRAAEGTIYGGTIGAAAGGVLFLALVFSLCLLPNERNR